MKKHYTLILLQAFLLVFLAGCSKDFLKPYEDRVEGGVWELHEINSYGLGRGYMPAFTGGRFEFLPDRQLHYVDQKGNEYEGTWELRKQNTDDGRIRKLTVTAIDFANQRVLTQTFDDMQFSGTDRFRGYVYAGNRSYVFRFRR